MVEIRETRKKKTLIGVVYREFRRWGEGPISNSVGEVRPEVEIMVESGNNVPRKEFNLAENFQATLALCMYMYSRKLSGANIRIY